MKGKILVLICFSAVMLQGCKGEKKSDDTNTQMEDVMAIHDEIMPKMGVIGKLVGQLKTKVDSAEAGSEYEKAMKDLQEAHTAMNDWMQGFGNRFDSSEILDGKPLTEQKKQWLNEEEAKVKALQEQINRSIEKAKAVLRQ